jgi:hypothetical protein
LEYFQSVFLQIFFLFPCFSSPASIPIIHMLHDVPYVSSATHFSLLFSFCFSNRMILVVLYSCSLIVYYAGSNLLSNLSNEIFTSAAKEPLPSFCYQALGSLLFSLAIMFYFRLIKVVSLLSGKHQQWPLLFWTKFLTKQSREVSLPYIWLKQTCNVICKQSLLYSLQYQGPTRGIWAAVTLISRLCWQGDREGRVKMPQSIPMVLNLPVSWFSNHFVVMDLWLFSEFW